MVLLSVHNSADVYGASQSLLRLVRRLVADDHKVHVVLPCPGPLADKLRDSKIRVHIFPSLAIIDRAQLGSLRGQLKFVSNFFASVLWLARVIREYQIDAVHTNTSVIPASAMAARLTGRRHFWHIREFFSEFPSFWKTYQRYVALLSTTIITNSEATRQQFIPRLQQKCKVIYNGLDAESGMVEINNALRFRSNLGNPKFLVGVVGRIKWVRKGQEVLVQAAALLAKEFPDIRYVIVGSCALGNEDHLVRLHQLIREKRLEDRFFFTGDLERLRDVYAAFDLTVVPSVLPEPFGCVVVESMAAGTPVVGSRCGGIPEQIVDGVTGYLVTPGDEVDLSIAIAKIISNNSLRSNMADESRRRFHDMFSLDTTYHSFAKIIGVEAQKEMTQYQMIGS
ncbi:glycosyltransferase family 4 protein [Granulicella sp. dw_53]|uniref:glycosyltransferase family 4 protein n=1 Tax=Granulicella sp. dw_53 TaxID=2719792 RepID=UPI001BD657BA|nr:glycosyltransferase family 4 protein [Granulicella sp. dw_53]